MNIQQLKYFIEVANTHQLSAAARNLFVTQPTVSLALKKLEKELDTVLFTHKERPYQLTETGLHLYTQGSDIIRQFDQLLVEIHQLASLSHSRKITLGITSLFAVQFMEELLLFLNKYPHIDLEIKQSGSAHLQTLLKDKEIDIGLLSFPNLYPEELNFTPLETTTRGYHVYVVVPATHHLAKEPELTFEELRDERFSSLSQHFMLGRLLIERSQDLGFVPNIILYNDDIQVILHSLVKNKSLALLPIEYRDIGKSDNLHWIPLNDKNNFYPIGIALHQEQVPPDYLYEFIQHLKNN